MIEQLVEDYFDVNEENIIVLFDQINDGEREYEEWKRTTVPRTDPAFVYAITATLMLLMGKQLNSENYTIWTTARVGGASAKAGVKERVTELLALFPDLQTCTLINQKIQSIWKVRALIFSAIRTSQAKNGPLGNLGEWTFNLMAWSEATHLHVIIVELVLKRPEALILPCFRGEIPYLVASLQFLDKLGSLHPYFQLTHGPSSDRATTSKNFKVMTAVSWALQGRTQPTDSTSNSNYKGVRLTVSHPTVQMALHAIRELEGVATRSEKLIINDHFSKAQKKSIEEILANATNTKPK